MPGGRGGAISKPRWPGRHHGLLAVLASEASAQQRTFYDSTGKSLGRSTTDSAGTVTNYDVRGRVISRETTTGNTATIYDAGGRNVGRVTTNR